MLIKCLKQGIKNRNSVLNRVGKSAIFVLNRVRLWGAAPHLPTQGYVESPSGLPSANFPIFTFKNSAWRTYLSIFTVLYCFLFRFVCIKLFSLFWFLQIWVAIYFYGTMINWFTLIKKLMQTNIVTVYGSILNVSTVHLNSIWHLLWR